MDAHTLPSLVHSACIALGVLLVLLLLGSRKGNRAANLWLMVFVSCLTLLWVGDLLEETGTTLKWPWAAHTTDWLIFVVGPCLWIYVRRLTGHERPGMLALLLHSALALACIGLLMPFYLLPSAAKIAMIRAEQFELQDELNIPLLVAAAQIMGYWVACLVTLQRFNVGLRERYSHLGARSFNWLRTMLSITLGMWLVWVIGILLHTPWTYWFGAIVVPSGLYLLAFFGFREPAAFIEEEARTAADDSGGRYARSGLDRERVPEFLARLDALMRTEKPWLENDLKLADLSARANLTPHNLSQLLNEEIGRSFFDYINLHRVAEVKRCLGDAAYSSQTILDIALAAGFSSKTAFNAAFRQHTGTTPSQFRRRARDPGGMQSA